MRSETGEKISETFFERGVVKNCFIALAVFLSLPNSLFSDYYLCRAFQPDRIELCLDQSWQTALGAALENGFVFGRDFVFTYGPLGFLSTRAGIGVNFVYLLLFDLFVAANIAFIVRFVWKRHYNAGTVAVALLLLYLSPLADASFKLLAIMIFYLCRSLEKPSVRYFIVPFGVALVSFFIKLNTSFPALLFFYLFLAAALVVHKKLDAGRVILAVLLPVLLVVCSRLLHVELSGYLGSGLQLISSYNDSMNYISPAFAKYNLLVALLSFLTLTGFGVLFWRNKKNPAAIVVLPTLAAILFILFKQSMVRSDGLHLFAFFYFAPLLWLFAQLFLYRESKFVNPAILGAAVLTILAGILPLRYDADPGEFNPLGRFKYLADLVKSENPAAKDRTFENFRLPAEIIEIIGTKSVDVIPHNVNLIYFNRLRYNPRPVFQTYAAYSEKLAALNRQKYEGADGPDFVIFSNEALDNRYAFFDDAGAKLALLENYAVARKFEFKGNEYLLFAKNVSRKPVSLGETRSASVDFGRNFDLPDPAKTYFAKIDVEYSVFGALSKFLYQPLNLKIVFELDDGTAREFRAVVPILKGGVMLNPLVETNAEHEAFFSGGRSSLKKIESLRIQPVYSNYFEKLNLLNYREPVKIELRELNQN